MLIVSVSRHAIHRNFKEGRNDPPFEIRRAKDDTNPERVHSQEFHGTIRLIYDKDAPLASHANCWVEIDEVTADQLMALNAPVALQQVIISCGVSEVAKVVDGG